jgi:hypothetical protein
VRRGAEHDGRGSWLLRNFPVSLAIRVRGWFHSAAFLLRMCCCTVARGRRTASDDAPSSSSSGRPSRRRIFFCAFSDADGVSDPVEEGLPQHAINPEALPYAAARDAPGARAWTRPAPPCPLSSAAAAAGRPQPRP